AFNRRNPIHGLRISKMARKRGMAHHVCTKAALARLRSHSIHSVSARNRHGSTARIDHLTLLISSSRPKGDSMQPFRAVRTREIYRSPNGDRWLLARDPDIGRVFVRHEPNLPSGGQVADIEIGAFLIAAGNGPEKQELLRLIGTLA